MDSTRNTSVSNNSPQSPVSGALLDNPITLDFDPMSFQFKEDSPLTSPSENSRELTDTLSPLQNLDVVDFFDPFCPVKEESPTDYYPTVTIEQTTINLNEPDDLDFSSIRESVSPLVPDENFQEEMQSTNGYKTETSNVDILSPHIDSDYRLNSNSQSPLELENPESPENLESPSEPENLILIDTNLEREQNELVDNHHISEINDFMDNSQHDHDFEQDEDSEHEECDVTNTNILNKKKTNSTISSSISSSTKVEKKSKKIVSTSSSEDSLKETKNYQNAKSEEKVALKSDQKSNAVKSPVKSPESRSGKGILSSNMKNGIDTRDSSLKKKEHENGDIHREDQKSKKKEEPTENFEDGVKPSVDRAKVQRTFSQTAQDDTSLCKICQKHVYHMEKMKAERAVFHKNCFRCKECNKLLNVDSYSSNEGDIYCKPHFKQLFQPKARFDGDDIAPKKQRRNEVIIRENVPAELPPDVVRSDSKPDHGLESLPVNLSNLKSKFEQYREEHHLPSTTDVCTLQRSASVMARLAKYQSAVAGEGTENGNVSESESEGECEADPSIVKPTKHKEKVVFSGMSNLKSQWETGSVNKEEKVEEKKEELFKLRQRMSLGRSESMKAVYEKACQESTKSSPSSRVEHVDIARDTRATRLKEKFEKGEMVSEVDEEKLEKARREKEEDLSVFTEPVMATDAKKLFKQIDEKVKTSSVSPLSPSRASITEHNKNDLPHNLSSIKEGNIVRCSEPTEKEEIPIDTTDLSQRFKFFENYSESPHEKKRFQMTPPREPPKENSPEPVIPHDPNIVRAVDSVDDIPATDTARRMLDKFKALEKETPSVPLGPKPLKRITPPREYTKVDNHDSSPEPERDPNIIRSSYKTEEGIIVEADKARSLRAKFENWDLESKENQKNEDDLDDDFLPQVDTTKTLRAKFEAFKEETLKTVEKPKPKVNRFV